MAKTADGQETPVELPVPGPKFRSVVLDGHSSSSLQVWTVPWRPTGFKMWWCAGDLLHAMHPTLEGDKVVRWVLN